MDDEKLRHLAAENCSGYEGDGLTDVLQNSFMSMSCDRCIHNRNGVCKRHMYNSVVMDIIRNN